MEMLMDTMLHELSHNIHGDHDQQFYKLFEELKDEWRLLTSKGYRGEGFFSQGQRLGTGHAFYKPRTALGGLERRRVKDALERKERGIVVGPNGRRLGDGPDLNNTETGKRLGGTDLIAELTPRELAAIAAEQRSMDQNRCGAKQLDKDMKRERERAARESTRTRAQDLPVIDDLGNYELDDIVNGLSIASAPSQSSAGSLGDWYCNRCTVKNPPLYLSCSICSAERKLGSDEGSFIDLTAEEPFTWECEACTFMNENGNGTCSICGKAA
jgi:DNA-dependent metalloprotease WSS1